MLLTTTSHICPSYKHLYRRGADFLFCSSSRRQSPCIKKGILVKCTFSEHELGMPFSIEQGSKFGSYWSFTLKLSAQTRVGSAVVSSPFPVFVISAHNAHSHYLLVLWFFFYLLRVHHCAAVAVFCTVWRERTGRFDCIYVKRCRRIWRIRSTIKKGQKLKEFKEQRKNIVHLKVGRSNNMATGGSPSAWPLLIASPHLLTPQSPNEKRWRFFSEAKRSLVHVSELWLT